MALKQDGDKVKVMVVLTKDIQDRLKAVADRYGMGISPMVRIALTEWLDQKEKEKD